MAIFLGAGGAWLINGIAESTSDRILGASAKAIAETLSVEDGEITLDIPPFALGMLENNERDNIYYSVRHNGRLVTGYADLPHLVPLELEVPKFRYERYRGSDIRVAAEARRLPRIDGEIVIEVAETLDARRELARRMLLGLAALESVLVGVVALLVWPAVMWSLSPLTRLRQAMDARDADFTPLPLDSVPSELAGLVAGFNGLLTRLEASVEGIKRFTADASHQMRTPLAILRTHLSLVRKHGVESRIGQDSLADIQLATDRLQALLTGLITLARTEEGPSPDSLDYIDLGKLVRDVVVEMAPVAQTFGVQLEVRTPRRAIRFNSEPLLIKEMLSNLIDNSIRYNGHAGRVSVLVGNPPSGPSVRVEDDGPGIPESERRRAMSRFYRLARDQQTQGSGLGLSIVDAIASRIGAKVHLSDGKGGRGLRVTISFRRDPVF